MTGSPDFSDPAVAEDVLRAGAAANLRAPCRVGSTDVVDASLAPLELVATGDLHDNPMHLAAVLGLAKVAPADPDGGPGPHVTLHEVIHSDRLVNGVDLSVRALLRVAHAKARFPARVHCLLANHELAQIAGAGIVKDGLNVVKAFNDGVRYAYGDAAERVLDAVGAFVRSLPLALRVRGCGPAGTDLLCAHSLPGPDLLDRFDPGVLERELTEEDYRPRRGSAHIMVWGREQTPELLAALASRWGVGAFVLGHEKADAGWMLRPPSAIVLNSDHPAGSCLHLRFPGPTSVGALLECRVGLAALAAELAAR